MCKCLDGCSECVPQLKTPHKHAALIKAWADGDMIQFLQDDLGWINTTEPSWDADTEYRIKPETKPDVIRYARAIFNLYNETNPDMSYENARITRTFWTITQSKEDNIKAIFDGETGKLKSVAMLS